MTTNQRAARLERLTRICRRIADRIIENGHSRVLNQRLRRVQQARMKAATGPKARMAFAPGVAAEVFDRLVAESLVGGARAGGMGVRREVGR